MALRGTPQAIHEDQPQPGYYKMRKGGRDGPWIPVAIYEKDGEMLAIAGVDRDKPKPLEIWIWCAKNPVSKEAALHALKTGMWPGDAPLADVGDNSGDLSLIEQLRDYIETAGAWLKDAKIDSQEQADRAANYAAEVSRLKGLVDKERDAKVRPHLDAQREVNAEYKPIIDEADKLARSIKAASTDFLRAEKRRQEEEARRKYEAEMKARTALDEADGPLAQPEPVKVQAGGQRGRKMGLRKKTEYSIGNMAYIWQWAQQDPHAIEVMKEYALKCARAGEEVPGVIKETVEVAA